VAPPGRHAPAPSRARGINGIDGVLLSSWQHPCDIGVVGRQAAFPVAGAGGVPGTRAYADEQDGLRIRAGGKPWPPAQYPTPPSKRGRF